MARLGFAQTLPAITPCAPPTTPLTPESETIEWERPPDLNQIYTLHLQKVGSDFMFMVDNLPPQMFTSPATFPAKGQSWRVGTLQTANFPTTGADLAVVGGFDDVFVDIP